MRLFVGQTNDAYTDPVINDRDNTPITTAVVTLKLFLKEDDSLVSTSDVTLVHDALGVYRGGWPVMAIVADVANEEKYDVEFKVTLSGVIVFYLKGPIKAILRGKNYVP